MTHQLHRHILKWLRSPIQHQVNIFGDVKISCKIQVIFSSYFSTEESPFYCQDIIDFTMKQLNFLEDEFGYSQSLQLLRLWYISYALKVPEWMVERWFEIRRKSIKKTKNRKFPTSASNTQSTGMPHVHTPYICIAV